MAKKNDRSGLLWLAGAGAVLAGRELWQRWHEADISGNVAIVTGGSRGLGLQIARELAKEGCRLVICARDEAELARVREELERETEVLTLVCDVRDRTQVEYAVTAATARFGQVDIVINNAGIIQVSPAENLTIADYEDVLATNFWGTVYFTYAVLPQMLARQAGRIVNITSFGGKVPFPHMTSYVAAKHAAVGFTLSMGAELANRGITVTNIAPLILRTGSHLHAQFKGDQEDEYQWFALGASTPGTSTTVERTAREVVTALKRGQRERMIPISANFLVRLYNLTPAFGARLLTLVDRVLPAAQPGATAKVEGIAVKEQAEADNPLLDISANFGDATALRQNQFPDQPQANSEVH